MKAYELAKELEISIDEVKEKTGVKSHLSNVDADIAKGLIDQKKQTDSILAKMDDEAAQNEKNAELEREQEAEKIMVDGGPMKEVVKKVEEPQPEKPAGLPKKVTKEKPDELEVIKGSLRGLGSKSPYFKTHKHLMEK